MMRRRKGAPLTGEQVANIKELARAGWTHRQIAIAADCSRSTVGDILKRASIRVNRAPVELRLKRRLDNACGLVSITMTTTDAAEILRALTVYRGA